MIEKLYTIVLLRGRYSQKKNKKKYIYEYRVGGNEGMFYQEESSFKGINE